MLYALGHLLWSLINPGTLLLLLLLAGALLLGLGRRRAGSGCVLAAAGLALAVAVTPLDRWLLTPLEQRFAQPDPMPARVTGLVVLGGGLDVRTARAGLDSALNGAGDRLIASARLARRYPEARIVYASGATWPAPVEVSEATLAAELLQDLGVRPERLELEERSRNTFENARYARELAAPQPGETWLLVTSAVHMPRAVGCFRAVGWEVVPYPVDRLVPPRAPGVSQGMGWFDGRLGEGLVFVRIAVREYLGLLGYRLMGHIETLLPAPQENR
jgi:uncharacterized SAM-binding protein YcdF (DUF218 family)